MTDESGLDEFAAPEPKKRKKAAEQNGGDNGKRKPGKWYAKAADGSLTGFTSAERARRSICPDGNAIYVLWGELVEDAKKREAVPPKGGFWWAENPNGKGTGFATEGPALAHAVPAGVAWVDDGETIRL